jgi:4a-hydroxytetrahydrobiopterin dehydratase
MSALSELHCVTPQKSEPTLSEGDIYIYQSQIAEWQIKEVDGMKRLERVFKFKNFAEAMEFTNKVGTVAEAEDHHPLIITEWGRVTVQWWTHIIKGLHKNDFIMAAKADEIYI